MEDVVEYFKESKIYIDHYVFDSNNADDKVNNFLSYLENNPKLEKVDIIACHTENTNKLIDRFNRTSYNYNYEDHCDDEEDYFDYSHLERFGFPTVFPDKIINTKNPEPYITSTEAYEAIYKLYVDGVVVFHYFNWRNPVQNSRQIFDCIDYLEDLNYFDNCSREYMKSASWFHIDRLNVLIVDFRK